MPGVHEEQAVMAHDRNHAPWYRPDVTGMKGNRRNQKKRKPKGSE